MKILKVTRTESQVQFRQEVQGNKSVEEHDVIAHEAPLKSFDDSLQALTDVVANILEVGQGYKKGMVIVSLAVSYTAKGTRSATIVFTKELDATGAAHRMVTPQFRFDDPKEGDDGARQCAKKHAEMIQACIEETEKYAAGERQQRLLPLDDAKSQSAEPKGGDVLDFKNPPPGDDGQGSTPPPPPADPKAGSKKAGSKKKK